MSTLDEITKEKQRIAEALARVDAQREKAAISAGSGSDFIVVCVTITEIAPAHSGSCWRNSEGAADPATAGDH
jgi:hypothetical protein